MRRTWHFETRRLATLCSLVAGLVLASCTRPGLTDTDVEEPFVVDDPGVGIRMVDAGFWTNGTLRSDRINLQAESFEILFVFLKEAGLFVVTIEPTEASEKSGRFVGGELVFSGGRTEIRFASSEEHIFTDQMDRDAWVEFLPGFDISRPGASVEGAVVGLARQRSHVPGLQ